MSDGDHNILRSRIRRGALWSTLDVVINRTSGFLLGIVVARLLRPEDFGLYAVALVVHAILVNVSDLGVGAILVRDDDADVAASGRTVTTIALASSLLLGLFMALAAPELARLLGSPKAAGAIRVMAITLPLGGITAVPGGLLRREFQMKTIFFADTANNVGSGVAVIALALAGAGPLALAWSFVAGQLLTAIILLVRAPARYWPGWDSRQTRRVLAFCLPLVGANILLFTTQNVDYIVVGKLLGSVSLGLYMLAFNISGWPQNVLGFVIKSVSLPAFARLKESGAEMSGPFCEAVRQVVRVTLPICLFIGAVAHPLVLAVYGPRWSGASAALIGLVVLGATRALVELCSDFLTAMGKTKSMLAVQTVWLPALVAALLVLTQQFGIAGAGAAQAAVCALVVMPLLLVFVNRAAVPWQAVVNAILPTLCWALLAAALGWYVASRINAPVLATMVGGTVSMITYVLPYLPEMRRALAARQRRRHAPDTALAQPAG